MRSRFSPEMCIRDSGYPMAKQGRGAEALGWAAFASGFGSIVSWFLLVTLSPVLALSLIHI